MSADQIRLDEIVVGERARRDYGDLTSLMDSIQEHGILQPIGLAPGNDLLFGGRRLEAAKRLGLTVIDVTRPRTQTDALSLLRAERDENTCRKDMTASEMVDIGRRIEEMERPKVEARKVEAGRQAAERRWDGLGSTDPNPSEPKPQRTTDVVAEAFGTSGPTYKRMKSVVNAASNEDEDPEVREVATIALADLDSGKTSPRAAYERVREARRPEPVTTAPTLTRPQPPKFGGNRRKHAAVIDSMTVSLSGLAMAADEITELDGSVTAEEAARLAGDLSDSIRSINRLRKTLTRKATS